MKRVFLAIAAILTAIITAASCASKRAVRFVPAPYSYGADEADALADAIGISLACEGELEKAFIKSAEKYASARNFDIMVKYADNSAERQSNDIAELIEDDALALIVEPCDPDGIAGAVEEAGSAGIRIINIGVPANARVDTLIDPDYIMIGRKGARLAKEAKRDRKFEKLDILLIESSPTDFYSQLMHDGFVDELAEDGNIISVEHIYTDIASQIDEIDDRISAANVIFAWNQSISDALIAKGTDAAVITVGASYETLVAVREKSLYATVFFGTDDMAKCAVEEALKCVEDPEYIPPEYIELPLGVASESSVLNYMNDAPDGWPDPR